MDNYYTQNELRDLGIKKIGNNLKISKKASLYDCSRMEFGDHVRVDDFCVLSGRLVFGSHIHITAFCLLAGGDEGIFFGNFTTLAYRVSVFTRSDDYSGETLVNSTIPEKYRFKTIKKPVYIEKHAAVGTSSVVFPGAHLREGVSVGASSLVLKPTEAWGIYVGTPAKKIKDRKKDLLVQENEYLTEAGVQL
jgi:acetyltransferase-like isoleucine patch superfamily enzyme